jgi:hypothetical protein
VSKGTAAAKRALGGTPPVKKVTSRKKPAPAPPIADPSPVVHEVSDGMPEGTSFMGLLQDAEVNCVFLVIFVICAMIL